MLSHSGSDILRDCSLNDVKNMNYHKAKKLFIRLGRDIQNDSKGIISEFDSMKGNHLSMSFIAKNVLYTASKSDNTLYS